MFKLMQMVKPYGRLVNALFGFMYDLKRYYQHSAWRSDMNDSTQRSYNLVKVYHALEKSMTFSNRNVNSGWANAFLLRDILIKTEKKGDIGFHDQAGLSVLNMFINLDINKETCMAKDIRDSIKSFDFYSNEEHGSKAFSKLDLQNGMLDNPESFFFSRYSLREFKQEIVAEDLIKRAVSLALKTPSACNRQEWHVYHTSSEVIKPVALSFQSGNRGFGDNIPNLMVLTADLKAFMPGQEHYQHWIDGGMFSMSIIYALHSLGVASCCLNWSQSPSNDKMLRSHLNIRDHHTIIMMLAIGFPNENNHVCISARRPLNEVYSELELRDDNIS